jgi:transcriptional regulator with XRE-family HTH domain
MVNSHDAPRRHYLGEWREFRGLTQDDLSLLAGTSQNEIADYETGERRISLEMQYKLVWALGITSAQFFEPLPAARPRRDGSR